MQITRLNINGDEYILTDATKLPQPQEGAVGQLLTIGAMADGQVTQVVALPTEALLGDVEAALDEILAMQDALIGGDGE